ncbi:hypothetical protein [Nodosilinea sp. E11]|uniref:hypothetical protein n=1 Tax=Nodosilinea sp. E11 TaxID=3037479 RepID=UPI00293431FD|nr:hypothetical protein [Nodosilinea sp. E11]WOD39048.1 hypothetical protein RRF56_22845 [Nodosilinea sp. E11]
MASQTQIRNYLAHWFQLGKPVVLAGNRGECLPEPIFQNGQYSQSFEDCWHQIMVTSGQDCYLKGTSQSIAAMLSPTWEITACARCEMPIAVPTAGTMTELCPCNDLPTWPNADVPMPRTAVNDQRQLTDLRQRLDRAQERSVAPSRD